MATEAWRTPLKVPKGTPAETVFQVGHEDPNREGFYGGTHVGAYAVVTAPSYRNNYSNLDATGRELRPGTGLRKTTPEHEPTLFSYRPGKVTDFFGDPRARHAAGLTMGLVANWHRAMGAERNVAHGMPTYDSSLSTDSAPMAAKLYARGLTPLNQANPDFEVTNNLGRRDPERTGRSRYTFDVTREDIPVSRAEMAAGRETLRELFGRKRTAPLQAHPQKSNGEQLRLL